MDLLVFLFLITAGNALFIDFSTMTSLAPSDWYLTNGSYIKDDWVGGWWNSKNIRLNAGTLQLYVKQDPKSYPNDNPPRNFMYSGSEIKLQQTYDCGFFEISGRAPYPGSQGFIATIIFSYYNQATSEYYAFLLGNDDYSNQVRAGFSSNTFQQNTYTLNSFDFASYHVYGFNITKESKVSVFVDGNLITTFVPPKPVLPYRLALQAYPCNPNYCTVNFQNEMKFEIQWINITTTKCGTSTPPPRTPTPTPTPPPRTPTPTPTPPRTPTPTPTPPRTPTPTTTPPRTPTPTPTPPRTPTPTTPPPTSLPCTTTYPGAAMPQGFCARIYRSGLGQPRHIHVVSNRDILVVENAYSRITVLWDGGSAVLATAQGLAHGVEVDETNRWLYASNPTTVFRWSYSPGMRTNLGTPQIVVKNIPFRSDPCCGHSSRTVRIGLDGRLYVQSGSAYNVDSDTSYARIHRFYLSNIPSGGIDWSAGENFAHGLRNEVGIRFDNTGKLWGVENGVDDLYRSDLGGSIKLNHPAEEMNRFDTPGAFYGFPYCWSQGNTYEWSGYPGKQYVQDSYMYQYTDAWCRNPSNVVSPVFNFGAHTVPMDILFYYGTSFPVQYRGGAFVSLKGNPNSPYDGYRVVYVTIENGSPRSVSPFFYYQGPGQWWPNNLRPVGLAIGGCAFGQCLYVTSETTGEVIEISYRG